MVRSKPTPCAAISWISWWMMKGTRRLRNNIEVVLSRERCVPLSQHLERNGKNGSRANDGVGPPALPFLRRSRKMAGKKCAQRRTANKPSNVGGVVDSGHQSEEQVVSGKHHQTLHRGFQRSARNREFT